MRDGPEQSMDPDSTRPEVEVVFKQVTATLHGKPRSR